MARCPQGLHLYHDAGIADVTLKLVLELGTSC
jgi:hypothetical protein